MYKSVKLNLGMQEKMVQFFPFLTPTTRGKRLAYLSNRLKFAKRRNGFSCLIKESINKIPGSAITQDSTFTGRRLRRTA